MPDGLVEILPKYTVVPSTESSLQISGFQCFTNLGQPNCRRGVGVYVREGFQVSVINLPIFNVPWVESVWLDINLHDKKVCIGCIYRSPSAPSLEECESSLKKIIDGMASLVSQTVASDLIIIGDFNFPLVEWVDRLGHLAVGTHHLCLVYLTISFTKRLKNPQGTVVTTTVPCWIL